jgi:glycosyltransferase involved in cell wall biosynthesis
MTTRISVILPVYNGEKFIALSINSILNQTFKDFEFIIINDGSTDDTCNIIQSYRDSRVSIIDNEKSQGIATSLNLGLRCASGEIIIRQDADDISLPTRFEKQVAYLGSHPEVGVLGTCVRMIDEDGNFIREEKKYTDHTMIEWGSLFGCQMIHPSIAMRKGMVLEVGGYRAYETEDYDLWARLFEKTRFANLPESLLLYRRHLLSKTIHAPEIHKEHTYLILNYLRKIYLGRELNPDEMEGIEKARSGILQNSADDVVHISNIIVELTLAYINRKNLSSNDIYKIKRYSAELLFFLSYCNYKAYLHESHYALSKAISFDTRLLCRRSALRIAFG